MKSNVEKLKAKIRKAKKQNNPIFIDVIDKQHLNKIHVLLKRNGVKLDSLHDSNHIDEYDHYHYPSELDMGVSIHVRVKEYLVINWKPSKGSKWERKHTSNLF